MLDSRKLVASGLLITLSLWVTWTVYWAVKLYSSVPDIWAVPDPLGKLYFSSTMSLISMLSGLTLRAAGAALAVFTAVFYFRDGWNDTVRRLLGVVIVFEAIYLILMIPTAWVGPDVGDFVLVPEASIPAIFEAIFVPIPLLITAASLRWKGKTGTALRWASLSAVMYVFALFVRFTGQWIAVFIQTPIYTTFFGGFPSHGTSYILNYPLNMVSFLLTVVGLPLLAIFALITLLPVILRLGVPISLHSVGFALTLLGAYFGVAFFALYAFPGFVAEKSIWSSFFTGHNVDLWMFGLPAIGIPLMLRQKGAFSQRALVSLEALTQFLCVLFAVLAFGLTITFSSIHAPGGSLLNILHAQPVYRLPTSVVGGLFLASVLASLAIYLAIYVLMKAKPKAEPLPPPPLPDDVA
jgi:hypothetical protein